MNFCKEFLNFGDNFDVNNGKIIVIKKIYNKHDPMDII